MFTLFLRAAVSPPPHTILLPEIWFKTPTLTAFSEKFSAFSKKRKKIVRLHSLITAPVTSNTSSNKNEYYKNVSESSKFGFENSFHSK